MKKSFKKLKINKSTIINMDKHLITGGKQIQDSLKKDSLKIADAFKLNIDECPTSYCTRSDQNGCK